MRHNSTHRIPVQRMTVTSRLDNGTTLQLEDEKDPFTKYEGGFRLTDMNTSKSALDNMNLLGSKLKYPPAKKTPSLRSSI